MAEREQRNEACDQRRHGHIYRHGGERELCSGAGGFLIRNDAVAHRSKLRKQRQGRTTAPFGCRAMKSTNGEPGAPVPTARSRPFRSLFPLLAPVCIEWFRFRSVSSVSSVVTFPGLHPCWRSKGFLRIGVGANPTDAITHRSERRKQSQAVRLEAFGMLRNGVTPWGAWRDCPDRPVTSVRPLFALLPPV